MPVWVWAGRVDAIQRESGEPHPVVVWAGLAWLAGAPSLAGNVPLKTVLEIPAEEGLQLHSRSEWEGWSEQKHSPRPEERWERHTGDSVVQ